MSARTEVAAMLAAALPYRVLPYARNLDGVQDVTVMVETTRFTRQPGYWLAEITVYVVSGLEDPESVEDALEDATQAVLAVFADKPSVNDLSAERVVIQDGTYNAYTISLQVPFMES